MYSVVVIIALLGVLGTVLWSTYQISFGGLGSGLGANTIEEFKREAAATKLDVAKMFLQQDLTFSTIQSALKIAANGGTEKETYWFCGDEYIPPEPEEVIYALSSAGLNNMQSYVSNLREKGGLVDLGVNVSDYNCMGIYDPGEDVCDRKDSSECEYLWATATGDNIIEVKDPVYMADADNLVAYFGSNRFYWIYWRLYNYNYTEDIQKKIQNSIKGCVDNTKELIIKVKKILEGICDHMENDLFDSYVDCK
ncbi:MAG: hypothetical protein DRI92_05610, partial [Aquificota bacterium]